jgi:hypothetical protein
MPTALALDAPPEFFRDGTAPPLYSDPMPIYAAVAVVEASEGKVRHIATVARSKNGRRAAVGLSLAATPFLVGIPPLVVLTWQGWRRRRAGGAVASPSEAPAVEEARELVYSQLWMRDDPVVQLAPGVSQQTQFSVSTGISETRTVELASSLGLSAKASIDLSAQLSKKFGLELSLQTQTTRTDTVTLQNDSADKYRRYARWNVIHRLDVFGLDTPLTPNKLIRHLPLGGDSRSGRLLARVDVVASDAPIFTWAEVTPVRQ